MRTLSSSTGRPCAWIWPGEATLADASKLPDLNVLGYGSAGQPLPGWHVHAEAIKPFAARSQLTIDNLLDLTPSCTAR